MKMTVRFHNEKWKFQNQNGDLNGTYWCISSRKFQDGEINRWIIEIKRGAIKKVFFEHFQNSLC